MGSNLPGRPGPELPNSPGGLHARRQAEPNRLFDRRGIPFHCNLALSQAEASDFMNPENEQETRKWRASELSLLARSIYREAPSLPRLLMTLRPYICPFDRLIALVPQGSSVLDVGCGAGLFLGLLAATEHRFRGVGFDSSAVSIAAANAMARRVKSLGHETELRFLQLDAGAPWPEGPFDVVSIIDVLHHIPLPHRQFVLVSARAVLRPGGLLIYKDIGTRPRWRATANRIHDLLIAHEWVKYTSLSHVESWARQLGFAMRNSQRINQAWYGHDLVVFEAT